MYINFFLFFSPPPSFTDSLLYSFYVTLCKLLERSKDWTKCLTSPDLSFLILKLETGLQSLLRFFLSVTVNIQKMKYVLQLPRRGNGFQYSSNPSIEAAAYSAYIENQLCLQEMENPILIPSCQAAKSHSLELYASSNIFEFLRTYEVILGAYSSLIVLSCTTQFSL